MWTYYPPMRFSVHIMANILQKQLVWPQANSTFSASGNKGLSVNLARPEILPRQETKQELVLCLQQSFPLTWLPFARWTTGTFRSSILLVCGLKPSLFQVRSKSFPWVQCQCNTPRRDLSKQRLSSQHHAINTGDQRDLKAGESRGQSKTVTNETRGEKKEREEQFYSWVSHHWNSTCAELKLSGTSLPAGPQLVGVGSLPGELAIL